MVNEHCTATFACNLQVVSPGITARLCGRGTIAEERDYEINWRCSDFSWEWPGPWSSQRSNLQHLERRRSSQMDTQFFKELSLPALARYKTLLKNIVCKQSCKLWKKIWTELSWAAEEFCWAEQAELGKMSWAGKNELSWAESSSEKAELIWSELCRNFTEQAELGTLPKKLS